MRAVFFKAKVSTKRKIKRGFLLLEVLISLGLFAAVSGSASVPYYRFKQTLQKHYLELEAQRLSHLMQVIEQDPESIARLWPYWESVESKYPSKMATFWGPFEEEGMKYWTFETIGYVAEQTPKRASDKYPAWRRYFIVDREIYYGSQAAHRRLITHTQYAFTLFSKPKEASAGAL